MPRWSPDDPRIKTKSKTKRTKQHKKSLLRHRTSFWPRAQPWDLQNRNLRENCFRLHLFMLNLERLEPVSWQSKVKKLYIEKSPTSKIEIVKEISMFLYKRLNRITSRDDNPIFDTDFASLVRLIGFCTFYMVLERLIWKSVDPLVWRCREVLYSNIFGLYNFIR